MIFKVSFKKRFIIFILRVLNDYSLFIIIFIDVINSFNDDENDNEMEKPFEAFISIFKFNVSQILKPFFKRSRVKISHIHNHINMRNDYFVCNRCSRAYNVINDTKTIIKHLKKTHFIDFTINDIIKK